MIYVKVEGIGRVQKAMTGYARRIPKAGRAGLWNFAQHLARKLREEAPKGVSRWMSSKKGTYAKKVNKNEYVIKMPFYTKHVEEGTKPGYFIPKTPKLTRVIGINNFYKLKWHIHKHGTKAHPFTARVIRTEVKKLKKRVEKKINDSIKRTAG